MQKNSRPYFFPDRLKRAFRSNLRLLWNVILFLLSIVSFIALISYNSYDPSFNSYSDGEIHNKLGLVGAYFSDIILQIFGLSGFLLPIYGIYISVFMFIYRDTGINFKSIKLFTFILGMISFSFVLGNFPNIDLLRLNFSLGGILGYFPIVILKGVTIGYVELTLRLFMVVMFLAVVIICLRHCFRIEKTEINDSAEIAIGDIINFKKLKDGMEVSSKRGYSSNIPDEARSEAQKEGDVLTQSGLSAKDKVFVGGGDKLEPLYTPEVSKDSVDIVSDVPDNVAYDNDNIVMMVADDEYTSPELKATEESEVDYSNQELVDNVLRTLRQDLDAISNEADDSFKIDPDKYVIPGFREREEKGTSSYYELSSLSITDNEVKGDSSELQLEKTQFDDVLLNNEPQLEDVKLDETQLNDKPQLEDVQIKAVPFKEAQLEGTQLRKGSLVRDFSPIYLEGDKLEGVVDTGQVINFDYGDLVGTIDASTKIEDLSDKGIEEVFLSVRDDQDELTSFLYDDVLEVLEKESEVKEAIVSVGALEEHYNLEDTGEDNEKEQVYREEDSMELDEHLDELQIYSDNEEKEYSKYLKIFSGDEVIPINRNDDSSEEKVDNESKGDVLHSDLIEDDFILEELQEINELKSILSGGFRESSDSLLSEVEFGLADESSNSSLSEVEFGLADESSDSLLSEVEFGLADESSNSSLSEVKFGLADENRDNSLPEVEFGLTDESSDSSLSEVKFGLTDENRDHSLPEVGFGLADESSDSSLSEVKFGLADESSDSSLSEVKFGLTDENRDHSLPEVEFGLTDESSDSSLSEVEFGLADESSDSSLSEVGFGLADESSDSSLPEVGFGLADENRDNSLPEVEFGLTDESSDSSLSEVGFGLADESSDSSLPEVGFGLADENRDNSLPEVEFGLTDESSDSSLSEVKFGLADESSDSSLSEVKFGLADESRDNSLPEVEFGLADENRDSSLSEVGFGLADESSDSSLSEVKFGLTDESSDSSLPEVELGLADESSDSLEDNSLEFVDNDVNIALDLKSGMVSPDFIDKKDLELHKRDIIMQDREKKNEERKLSEDLLIEQRLIEQKIQAIKFRKHQMKETEEEDISAMLEDVVDSSLVGGALFEDESFESDKLGEDIRFQNVGDMRRRVLSSPDFGIDKTSADRDEEPLSPQVQQNEYGAGLATEDFRSVKNIFADKDEESLSPQVQQNEYGAGLATEDFRSVKNIFADRDEEPLSPQVQQNEYGAGLATEDFRSVKNIFADKDEEPLSPQVQQNEYGAGLATEDFRSVKNIFADKDEEPLSPQVQQNEYGAGLATEDFRSVKNIFADRDEEPLSPQVQQNEYGAGLATEDFRSVKNIFADRDEEPLSPQVQQNEYGAGLATEDFRSVKDILADRDEEPLSPQVQQNEYGASLATEDFRSVKNIFADKDEEPLSPQVQQNEFEAKVLVPNFRSGSFSVEDVESISSGLSEENTGVEEFTLVNDDTLSSDEFVLPSLELLADPKEDDIVFHNEEELSSKAQLLEQALISYGVKGEVMSVQPGPVVTLFEFEPAPGIKTSKIVNLSDDIARSMSTVSVRVSTIPGKTVIGIEMPNNKREIVNFKELLGSRDFKETSDYLPIVLGKDIGGNTTIVDLTKMPHLLIAGTTGSGKSVAVNTIIMSLLYRYTPEQVKFIMIDPKMLELSVYEGIPHLLSPVVTFPQKALLALQWVVTEMENRYFLMSQLGVRNIQGLNDKISLAKEKGEQLYKKVQVGFDRNTGKPIHERQEIDLEIMPFIVVVIDEMADLMLTSGKEVESHIQRLAQMARAAGIHLITATQRPSVDVITGTIKANFPTRISFQLTSKIDSRTIIGENGAEQLLGWGDMLYLPAGGRNRRLHGPFVSDGDVERVVSYLRSQGEPSYVNLDVKGDLRASSMENSADSSEDDGFIGTPSSSGEHEDELYKLAVDITLKENKASTSFIQRQLKIGYNRAARIVEQMEEMGIVTSPDRVGRRQVIR